MELKQDWPFYVSAGVLVAWLAAGIWLGHESHGRFPSASHGLVLAVAACLFAAPTFLRARYSRTLDIETKLDEFAEKLVNLESVGLELKKIRNAADDAAQLLSDIETRLEENLKRIEEAGCNQKRIEDGLMGQRQAAGEARRQIRAWEDAAIEYCRIFERILSFQGLDPSLRNWTERALSDFSALISSLGLHLIRPSAGSAFTEAAHIAESVEPSPEVEHERILRCVSWGFHRSSGDVLKAKVVLAWNQAKSGPDETSEPAPGDDAGPIGPDKS